jgi:Tol biopolymer transport system component
LGQGGVQPNRGSDLAAISAHGRYVAFLSGASNLVAGDTNEDYDVFVRDRVTRVTERVSVGRGGVQANAGETFTVSMSAHGRYVAFESDASNLVAGDTNRRYDVFVRNRYRGTTQRVSVGPAGAQANSHSYYPTISAHGESVAFTSAATNLVTGDSNERADIFVHRRATGGTRRVSVGLRRAEADLDSFVPAISADGADVAFIWRAPTCSRATPTTHATSSCDESEGDEARVDRARS